MNIEEAINHYLELKPCKNWIESIEPSFFFEFAETVITAYEKEKEKNRQGKMRIAQLKNEITARIEDVNQYYTPNGKIKAKTEELDEEIKVKREIAKNPMDRVSGRLLTDSIVELEKTKKVLQSLLVKE